MFQPDACLSEMLFHDGDDGAQVDTLRALAERNYLHSRHDSQQVRQLECY